MRSDLKKNRRRIIDAAARLLAESPDATLTEIASAAGVARSTLHRHFPSRDALVAEVGGLAPAEPSEQHRDSGHRPPIDPGRLGRDRPVALDGIDVFDAVPAAVLPDQLVAEAQRLAQVPLGLYVLDIDGSHLLRISGPSRLPERLEAPYAIGPELDADGIAAIREGLAAERGMEIVPLWLRGRAAGIFLTLGKPRASLAEMARQSAAALALADRHTDAFAAAQRRKRPRAAAEIQQSLLPPRIARVTGGEVAGNVLPSYEVAGDWFDVVENTDGVWISLADGLGPSTRSAASSAIALGALRAARRSGATPTEALMLMHSTLKQMPGSGPEMSAYIARWDPATFWLEVAATGHVAPVILRASGPEKVGDGSGHGLGGRTSPKPTRTEARLEPGERLVCFSDGVQRQGEGQAGLGADGIVAAALSSTTASAADTVRRIHAAAIAASTEELSDDATVVCLAVG
ncbi:SpoIIE family protein phosphatase [Thermoleophilia bacterium SCSIO 60948]|nr:SpoIIE family protein phosphatase [Thermoleophilia bacterium SCSIO 60948]